MVEGEPRVSATVRPRATGRVRACAFATPDCVGRCRLPPDDADAAAADDACMTATREQQLVEAAREGDGRAFARLVAPHRERLRTRCYRVLRSDHDADDALQEALVRAWRGLPGFTGGGDDVEAWLYRI